MFFSELKNIIVHPSVSQDKILNLLSQLTSIYDEQGEVITKKDYNFFFNNLQSNIHIYVLQDDNNELVGMAKLIIEEKLIHGGSKVGHIEDLVVDEKFRGKGYGKILLDYLIKKSKYFKCYKTILNCKLSNVGFYEKQGFKSNNVEMSLYFNNK